MNKSDILILGNGIAGLSCVKEIRKKDSDSTITMISKEPCNTYYRLKLTKYLETGKDDNWKVQEDQWYENQQVKVVLDAIIESVDVEKKEVRLDDGSRWQGDTLVIALGSSPFVPPIPGKHLHGVFAMRSIKDLEEIRQYMQDKKRVAILGGGLLGLEAAWSMKEAGKDVSIIVRQAYVLDRQLDEELGMVLTQELRNTGFTIYDNNGIDEILGDEHVTGLKLSSGDEIPMDLVMISTGVKPNLELFKDSPLEMNRGIAVDHQMQTHISQVYAIGDIAEVDGQNVGLWTSSNEQGRVAGKAITGQPTSYEKPKIFTSLDLGDLHVFSAGMVDKDHHDEVYRYDDEDQKIHHKLFGKDGKLVGGILMGDTSQMMELNQMINKRVAIEEAVKKMENTFRKEA